MIAWLCCACVAQTLASPFLTRGGVLWPAFCATGITHGVSWKTIQGGAEGLVSRDEMWAVAHRSRYACGERKARHLVEFVATV